MKVPCVTRNGVFELDIPEATGHMTLPENWNVARPLSFFAETWNASIWDTVEITSDENGMPTMRTRPVQPPPTVPEPIRYRKQQAFTRARNGAAAFVYYYATDEMIQEIRQHRPSYRLDPYNAMESDSLMRILGSDASYFWSYGFRKK